jgi:hypothetical protein
MTFGLLKAALIYSMTRLLAFRRLFYLAYLWSLRFWGSVLDSLDIIVVPWGIRILKYFLNCFSFGLSVFRRRFRFTLDFLYAPPKELWRVRVLYLSVWVQYLVVPHTVPFPLKLKFTWLINLTLNRFGRDLPFMPHSF